MARRGKKKREKTGRSPQKSTLRRLVKANLIAAATLAVLVLSVLLCLGLLPSIFRFIF